MDQEKLINWAFNEAVILVKQYGEVVEEMNSFLLSGTATVGECVQLIEDQLQ